MGNCKDAGSKTRETEEHDMLLFQYTSETLFYQNGIMDVQK